MSHEKSHEKNMEALDYVDYVDHVDYGTCCACGRGGRDVRNILMLDRRAPQPGTGWGCFVCGLPMDGALAVLCDTCLPLHGPTGSVRWVIDGLPKKNYAPTSPTCRRSHSSMTWASTPKLMGPPRNGRKTSRGILTNERAIKAMTVDAVDAGHDPRYWDLKYTADYVAFLQRAVITERFAFVTQKDFDELLEYSSTMPTGVFSNKVWKRLQRTRDGRGLEWLLLQYGAARPDGQCAILVRDLYVFAGSNDIAGG